MTLPPFVVHALTDHRQGFETGAQGLINDVAKVMGHEQTSTTLDRYPHSTRDRDRSVLASFAACSLPSDE